MRKKKKYSTVVIFDKSQPEPTTLSVKSKHLDRWKLYVLSGSVFLVLLFIALVFYAKQAARNERAAIMLEKYRKEVLKPLAIDTNVAKEYIRKIDLKLQKLEKYLKQRGVKLSGKTDLIHGNVKPSGQAIRTYVAYDKFLSEILRKSQSIPMGYPFKNKISSGFGYRVDPFGRRRSVNHHGIDIVGDRGDKIRVTANGEVIGASWNSGYGNCVVVKHASGYTTLYGHLSAINVHKGQKVVAGQCIGLMGSTGHSTGNHLHYEVHRKNQELNPIKFLTI